MQKKIFGWTDISVAAVCCRAASQMDLRLQLEHAERERETGTTNGTFEQRLLPTHHGPGTRAAALGCTPPDGTTLDQFERETGNENGNGNLAPREFLYARASRSDAE